MTYYRWNHNEYEYNWTQNSGKNDNFWGLHNLKGKIVGLSENTRKKRKHNPQFIFTDCRVDIWYLQNFPQKLIIPFWKSYIWIERTNYLMKKFTNNKWTYWMEMYKCKSSRNMSKLVPNKTEILQNKTMKFLHLPWEGILF